jgi:DNA-binding MarR family transcriptional regulator
MKLTAQQMEALERLRAMRDASGLVPVEVNGYLVIRTGLNTKTLARLKSKGLIRCENVWLNGNTSADLEIS